MYLLWSVHAHQHPIKSCMWYNFGVDPFSLYPKFCGSELSTDNNPGVLVALSVESYKVTTIDREDGSAV